MASSLQPPNSHSLSDDIVGGLVRSSRPALWTHPLRTSDAAPSGSPPLFEDVLARAETPLETQDVAGHKRLPSIDRVADISPVNNKKGRRDNQEQQQKATNGAAKTRRERCRINQARYRDRQRLHAVVMEDNIQHLKGEIYKLELKKQSLVASTPTNESVWNVAAEYFRLFRHGYMMPPIVEPSAYGSVWTETHAQLEFLQKTMTLDVMDGDLCGAEAILESWRLLSLYHKDVDVQLRRLNKGPGDSLVAMISTSLTITNNTLQQLYPHLASDQYKQNEFAEKLQGQRIVMKGSVRFDWDQVHGRVVRMEWKTDMLTPMLRLLGSLKDVALVFDGAFITPECRIVLSDRRS